MLGLKVATADGDPTTRTTSSRLCVPTSSLSTAPGAGAKPRRSVMLSQAAIKRAARASGTVGRMDYLLGSLEIGAYKMSWRACLVNHGPPPGAGRVQPRDARCWIFPAGLC